jgi:hypothetical protein
VGVGVGVECEITDFDTVRGEGEEVGGGCGWRGVVDVELSGDGRRGLGGDLRQMRMLVIRVRGLLPLESRVDH